MTLSQGHESFEQTMMGWSPRCYIPSFVAIGPALSGEEDFGRVFNIYGYVNVGHLGYVTSIMLMNFHFHDPVSLHTEFDPK